MIPSLSDILISAQTAVSDVILGSPDSCSLYNVTYTSDGTGGTSSSDGLVVASGVKGIYYEASFKTSQIAGGMFADITHELYLEVTSATRAIKPNYAIVFAARGTMPQLRFENPVILEETFGTLVYLGAQLKK